jgi:hypothetical protein
MPNCITDRSVQPQAGADLRHLFRDGGVAGDDHGGIPRREPQHQEYQHRDDQQDRDGGEDAPGEEVEQ